MKIYHIYYFIYFLISYFLFQLIYSKDIWVFLIGNIISKTVYILLNVILINKENLQLVHKTLGWFFIEHILEDYHKNTGKFFLTNRDFRQKLILNVFILFKNIIFWSYFTTLFELMCLILILIFLSYILFLCIFYDNKKIKLKQLLFLTLYCLLLLILFFKLSKFTYLDIYYILKPIFLLIQLIINIYCLFAYLYLILNLFIIFLFDLKINFLNLIYLILKAIFYGILILLCITFVINILIFYHKTNNNFLQEFFIPILYIIYLFFSSINCN